MLAQAQCLSPQGVGHTPRVEPTGGIDILRFVRAETSGRWLKLPGLHDVIWWLLAIGIVVAGAQLVWIAVTPVSPLGDWKPSRVRLMDERARSALMTGFDPFNRDVVAHAHAGTSAVVTDLPLTLFGIRVNHASGGGTAIIAGSDGEQQLYRIGEDVSPGVTLSAVAFDHVTLNRGGAPELLYLDQSKPVQPIAPAPAPAAASPAARGPGLSAAQIRQGISFGGMADGGGVNLKAGADGSAFRNAGLREGDVLVAVNGDPIADSGDLAEFAGQVRPGSLVILTVRRAGRDVPLNLTVSE